MYYISVISVLFRLYYKQVITKHNVYKGPRQICTKFVCTKWYTVNFAFKAYQSVAGNVIRVTIIICVIIITVVFDCLANMIFLQKNKFCILFFMRI